MTQSYLEELDNERLDMLAAVRVMKWRIHKFKTSSGHVRCSICGSEMSNAISKMFLYCDYKSSSWHPSIYIANAFELLDEFESWSMKYDPEESLVTVCLMHDGNRYYSQQNSAERAITITAIIAMTAKG